MYIRLGIIYCWVLKPSNAVVCSTYEISEPTNISYRDVILEKIKMKLKFFYKISRLNKIIQVYEAAISKGRMITNPTSTQDTIAGKTWLTRGIEKESDNFFLKIIPNRSANIIMNLSNIYNEKETIIRTDGFASYRSAVVDFGLSTKSNPYYEIYK